MRLVWKGLLTVLMLALLGFTPAAAQDDDPWAAPEPAQRAPRTTTCLQCQPLADAYNEALPAVQAAEAEKARLDQEMAALNRQIAEAEERLDTMRYRERRAADDVRVGRLNEMFPSDLKKLEDKLATAERNLAEAEAVLARLNETRQQAETVLEAARTALAQAQDALTAAAGKLDDCENLCKARGGISTITPDGFVVTWCKACQQFEDAVNQTIRERRRIDGLIVLAKNKVRAARSELDGLESQQQAASDAAVAATGEVIALRGAKNPDAAAINEANQRASDGARRMLELDDEIGPAREKLEAAEKALEELEARRDQLPQLEADQRAALADCEQKMCGPQGQQPLGQVGTPAPTAPVTVTTDCPACKDFAAALQETLDAIRGKQAEIDAIGRDLAKEREAVAAADAAIESARRSGTSNDAAETAKVRHGVAIDRLEYEQGLLVADFNALVELAKEQRTDLENCEKSCKVEPPARAIPDLRVSLRQEDEECRRNRECAVALTLTNETGTPYSGQLFISTDFALALPRSGMLGDAFCANASKGKAMCYFPEAGVEEGGTLTLILPAVAELGVCVTLETPYEKDPFGVSAWVQFGLTQRGYSLGTIDGQTGRRTLAAIDEFLASDDAAAPVGLSDEELRELMQSMTPENRHLIESEIFERLFGTQPATAEEREDMRDCIDLKLVREAVTRQPAPPSAQPDTPQPDEPADPVRTPRAPDTPAINLQFNLGGGEEDEFEREFGNEREGVIPVEPRLEGLPGLGNLGGFGF